MQVTWLLVKCLNVEVWYCSYRVFLHCSRPSETLMQLWFMVTQVNRCDGLAQVEKMDLSGERLEMKQL